MQSASIEPKISPMMKRFVLPLFVCAAAFAAGPAVFPEPRELSASGKPFEIDQKIVIVGEPALARLVQSQLADRYGVAVRTTSPDRLASGDRAIVIRATPDANTPKQPEGYLLDVTANHVLLAGADAAGVFYGVQSLRQLIERAARRHRGPRPPS